MLHHVTLHLSFLCLSNIVPRARASQEWGSVDVAHPGNSTAQHPDSAFSPVQVALARLEALTDVKPAAYCQHADLYEARSTRGRWALRCLHRSRCLCHSWKGLHAGLAVQHVACCWEVKW